MFLFVLFFFFKQKTAYEMRISDWSSDVCSSDLPGYGILNAQMGYGAEDGSWRLSVFARNLLDKYYVAGIFTTPFDSGVAGSNPLSTRGYSNNPAMDYERTVGVKLDVAF